MQTTVAATIGPMAIVDAYNAQVRRRFPERYSPLRAITIAKNRHVQQAVDFLEWCEENEIEHPLIFIDLYFAHLYTTKRLWPRFDALRADKLIDFYREVLPSILENIRLKADPENHPDRRYYRSLALLTRAQEGVRRDYVLMGRSELCEIEIGVTGGYHPKSPSCAQCPRVAPCAMRLNKREGFDVALLRNGQISALPRHIRKHLTIIG
jgi:hypothetical protein